MSYDWRLNPTHEVVRAKAPWLLKAISIISILVGLLCAVPAVYYTYLNINPPVAGSGDLYFGDGTGFVLGAMAGCPAVAALTAGILIPVLWRRGHTTGATVVATLAPLPWVVVLLLATASVWL
jgi:hypothetical protein